jgi:hypothetical protein
MKEAKKKNNKSLKNSSKKNSRALITKRKNTDEIFSDEQDDFLLDDDYTSETHETEEPEDDVEFINDIKKFELEHLNSKLENVYQLIGKPKLKKISKTDNKTFREEYGKLISLLDDKRIIVHFQNDYPIEEKYKFITEEIFQQYVEDVSNTNLHINFIYEDFHPELDEEEEDY